MIARACPCPRRESLEGERVGKIWKHGDACRKRAIRAGATPEVIKRAKRAANPDKARTRRGGGPRGIALPFRRTFDALVDYLMQEKGETYGAAEDIAREILLPQLSPTNRARVSRLEKAVSS